jgi:hypothetical protein
MKTLLLAVPLNTLLNPLILFAQSAFYDALPANRENRGPIAPADAADKRAPREGLLQRWMTAVDNWLYRQTVRERERYLAKAKDVFELEERMRHLERRPHHYY